jgi:hypothetical protein
MTGEQARKLLGGYATNSLTEAERKALFEAALDDQDLFDALQQEQALKELLADPASRNQIARALADPPASRPRRAWLWGGVPAAIAAAALIVVVIRSNQQPKYQVARVVPPPATMTAEPPQPTVTAPVVPKSRNVPPAPRKAMPARILRESPPAPAAAPEPTPQIAPQQGVVGGIVPSDRATVATGAVGFATNFRAPQLQYSLLKRDATGVYSPSPSVPVLQPGDAVRLNVMSAIDGYLSLYQLDPSGDWKRLFPAAEPGQLVAANIPAAIPDSPIIVTAVEQRFRLTLAPANAAPLTIELTIAPAKVP